MQALRSSLVLACLAALAPGCVHAAHPTVDGGVLGRVVIYRNGVAFYERRAVAHNGVLTVHVPRERVDDFLKSLTVVDPTSRKPLAVTIPRSEDGGNSLTMTLETPDHPNAEVLLTYVTEAPAWKPSYRVVVGDDGKVVLEGWAIVDNVSGEDWNGVLVGVGASSALAFRYDLWSVRRVDRDLLAGEERFAVAPPTGVSPYQVGVDGGEELTSIDADDLGTSFSGGTSLENHYIVEGINPTNVKSQPGRTVGAITGTVTDAKSHEQLAGVTVVATSPSLQGEQTALTDDRGFYRFDALPPGSYALTYYYDDATFERKGVNVAVESTTQVAMTLHDTGSKQGEVIAIKGTVPTDDYTANIPVGRTFGEVLGAAAGSTGDATGTAIDAKAAREKAAQTKLHDAVARVLKDRRTVVLEIHGTNESEAKARGEKVRNRLVDEGIPATRVAMTTKIGASESPRVRVLAIAPGQTPPTSAAPPRGAIAGGDAPVGESRFIAERPMTVRASSSAMVAMVRAQTPGGVVYLYDPVSDRGDARFAFRSVQLDNPTTDTLEPGPVTVYGDGRFIGEGITEAVPPHASVVVPFALDKQIVVDHSGDEKDRIAKLVTVQRGMVTAEIQHRRTTTLTLTSRLAEPSRVFVRHKLEPGWKMDDAPKHSLRVGDSDLYEVDLAAGATQTVTIAESMPMERTLELSSQEALDMMKLYVDDPDAPPELVAQIRAALATHRDAVDLVDKIATMRDQLADYRARSGELHAQLVTLKAVHTGGELMTALHARLSEISERIQKMTIAIVDAQEQLMLARVKFQNQLADLHLGDKSAISAR